jgi:acetyl-CoA carboxylase alpha subunit
MPKPEGYRKALRLMKMAEKFSMPIVTFIDTPGAYPGIGAEERGQSEAIASAIAFWFWHAKVVFDFFLCCATFLLANKHN